MEIETKIFDVKKIRKILKKKEIKPHKICDIVDFFFDLGDFSARNWEYVLPQKGSGCLMQEKVEVEIPSIPSLVEIQDFMKNGLAKGAKIRLRLQDNIPFITIKGPKQTSRGVKSRQEIETRIGSLSDMMKIMLSAGAKLIQSMTKTREIYHIPKHKHSELIIDTFYGAQGILEYAEIECPSEEELHTILKKTFHLDVGDISDEGITKIHKKKSAKSVLQKIVALEENVKK